MVKCCVPLTLPLSSRIAYHFLIPLYLTLHQYLTLPLCLKNLTNYFWFFLSVSPVWWDFVLFLVIFTFWTIQFFSDIWLFSINIECHFRLFDAVCPSLSFFLLISCIQYNTYVSILLSVFCDDSIVFDDSFLDSIFL